MMPGEEINRRSDFPQRSQVVKGASLMLCFTSTRLPQLSH